MGRKKKTVALAAAGAIGDPASTAPGLVRRGWRRRGWQLVVWLVCFLGLTLAAGSAGRFNPFNRHYELYTFLASFATLMTAGITTILVINGLLQLRLSLWTTSLAAVVAAMTLLIPFETRDANLLQYLVLDAAVIVIAVGLGALGARLLSHAGYVIPVFAAATALDLLGLAWGPSLDAGARPELLSHFWFYYPLLGAGGESGALLELADLAFLALAIAVGLRHGFDRNRLMLGLAVALMALMICTWFTPVGLPVIPFLALFVAAGEWRRLVADRHRLARAALIAAGAVAAVVLALVLWGRSGG